MLVENAECTIVPRRLFLLHRRTKLYDSTWRGTQRQTLSPKTVSEVNTDFLRLPSYHFRLKAINISVAELTVGYAVQWGKPIL